tara:strand:- start:298 stop:1404 length:1107 start_codon:yes stop_codon:yes gene_type:complete
MDSQCWAPWNTIYEGLLGQVSCCCQTPVLEKSDSYEEAYEKWESLRESYRLGIKPKECEHCPPNVHDFHTNKIGKTNNPAFFDILFSNKCNFACLGCKPSLSSTINKLYAEPINVANQNSNLSHVNGRWRSGNKKKIEYLMKHAENIKEIHLNGGEPFLQDDIYELLEWLIKKEYNKNIRLWSHTNGSVIKYKEKDLVNDYMVHFKDPYVVMSLDGFGERGEYVRWGLKMKKWLKVYRHIKESDVKVTIHSCYNVFNCLVLHRWYEWFLDNNVRMPDVIPWDEPKCYSAKFIQYDRDLFELAKKQLLKIPKNLEYAWKQTKLLNFISEPMSDLKTLKKSFHDSITMFDIMRDTDFISTFPELKTLYVK